MKQFTLKDFLLYGEPCICCNKPLRVFACKVDIPSELTIGFYQNSLCNNNLKIILYKKYKTTLELNINIKSNRYNVSNQKKFKDFLSKFTLKFTKRCVPFLGQESGCGDVHIISNFIKFNENGFIEPITLQSELILLENDNIIYDIHTLYDIQKTEINIQSNTILDIHDETIVIPALQINKYKTKEKLLKKLKTYILFS